MVRRSRDGRTIERVDDLDRAMNEILVGQLRPGGEHGGDDRDLTRKSAVQMCEDRHALLHQKNEGQWGNVICPGAGASYSVTPERT